MHDTLAVMSLNRFMFTSESVNEGHPDKLCDQVRFRHTHIFVVSDYPDQFGIADRLHLTVPCFTLPADATGLIDHACAGV